MLMQSGRYYDNMLGGAAQNTAWTAVANEFNVFPFYVSNDVTLDRLAVYTQNSVAGAQMKLVVYESHPTTGNPDVLLHETAALDTPTQNTLVTAIVSLALTGGRVYWLGTRHSAGNAITGTGFVTARNIGGETAPVGPKCTILQRSLAFASAAPNPYAEVSTDRQTGLGVPNVLVRVA